VRLLSGVKDFDEHTVHVVGLDSVPEERDENEVVAEHVGQSATEARVGEMFGDVEHNEQDCQRR